MPTLEATVLLKQDGVDLVTPITYRLAVDATQAFDYAKATGGGAVTLPVSAVSPIQVALVRTLDEALLMGLTNLSLNAGGFLLLVNGSILASNLTVNNSSGDPTQIVGAVGGTAA